MLHDPRRAEIDLNTENSGPLMTTDPQSPELANVTLVRETRTRVRDLKGFRKSHQVPSEANEHTNSFVGRIAAEDISQDLESRFSDLRKFLNLKRVDLQVSEPDAGVGMIVTPWFDYLVRATVSRDDAAEVLWRRQVAEFRQPLELFAAGFSSAFGNLFDTVELEPAAPIDLAGFIDQIEERGVETIAIDYDRNATWCHINLSGVMGQVRLTSDRVSLVLAQPQSPARLLEAFLQVRSRFAGIECFSA